MTQPTTAASTVPGLIPTQRTVPATPAHTPAGPAARLRRTLAIVRGLRSLRTVPAGPRISYGESDGQ